MTIQDRIVSLDGLAAFVDDPGTGPALRIDIDNAAGSFSMLVSEADWKGTIQKTSERNTYAITLVADGMASQSR